MGAFSSKSDAVGNFELLSPITGSEFPPVDIGSSVIYSTQVDGDVALAVCNHFGDECVVNKNYGVNDINKPLKYLQRVDDAVVAIYEALNGSSDPTYKFFDITELENLQNDDVQQDSATDGALDVSIDSIIPTPSGKLLSAYNSGSDETTVWNLKDISEKSTVAGQKFHFNSNDLSIHASADATGIHISDTSSTSFLFDSTKSSYTPSVTFCGAQDDQISTIIRYKSASAETDDCKFVTIGTISGDSTVVFDSETDAVIDEDSLASRIEPFCSGNIIALAQYQQTTDKFLGVKFYKGTEELASFSGTVAFTSHFEKVDSNNFNASFQKMIDDGTFDLNNMLFGSVADGFSLFGNGNPVHFLVVYHSITFNSKDFQTTMVEGFPKAISISRIDGSSTTYRPAVSASLSLNEPFSTICQLSVASVEFAIDETGTKDISMTCVDDTKVSPYVDSTIEITMTGTGLKSILQMEYLDNDENIQAVGFFDYENSADELRFAPVDIGKRILVGTVTSDYKAAIAICLLGGSDDCVINSNYANLDGKPLRYMQKFSEDELIALYEELGGTEPTYQIFNIEIFQNMTSTDEMDLSGRNGTFADLNPMDIIHSPNSPVLTVISSSDGTSQIYEIADNNGKRQGVGELYGFDADRQIVATVDSTEVSVGAIFTKEFPTYSSASSRLVHGSSHDGTLNLLVKHQTDTEEKSDCKYYTLMTLEKTVNPDDISDIGIRSKSESFSVKERNTWNTRLEHVIGGNIIGVFHIQQSTNLLLKMNFYKMNPEDGIVELAEVDVSTAFHGEYASEFDREFKSLINTVVTTVEDVIIGPIGGDGFVLVGMTRHPLHFNIDNGSIGFVEESSTLEVSENSLIEFNLKRFRETDGVASVMLNVSSQNSDDGFESICSFNTPTVTFADGETDDVTVQMFCKDDGKEQKNNIIVSLSGTHVKEDRKKIIINFKDNEIDYILVYIGIVFVFLAIGCFFIIKYRKKLTPKMEKNRRSSVVNPDEVHPHIQEDEDDHDTLLAVEEGRAVSPVAVISADIPVENPIVPILDVSQVPQPPSSPRDESLPMRNGVMPNNSLFVPSPRIDDKKSGTIREEVSMEKSTMNIDNNIDDGGNNSSSDSSSDSDATSSDEEPTSQKGKQGINLTKVSNMSGFSPY